MLILKSKPIQGAYNVAIVNGSFAGSIDPWLNQNSNPEAWVYTGGSVTVDGVSTPGNVTKQLTQNIAIVSGESYDFTLTKEITSFDTDLKTRLTLSKLGESGVQQILNSTNSADGSFPLTGSFVATANYNKISLEIGAEAV